jgi:hypothetical protein
MPSRLIVRFSMDYLVQWTRLVSSAHDGDLLRALVQATVFQASTDHLDPPRPWVAGALPGEEVRTITIYALAAALGQPRETVRRKVQRLVALGHLTETPAGVCVTPGNLEAERARAALAQLAAVTQGFLAVLAGAGVNLASALPDLTPPEARALLARTSNTYCLRLVDDMSRLSGGDIIRPLVFAAVSVSNTRHLRSDVLGPYVEFDEPLPDSARRPVTAIALAREMGLPRETARRYLAKVEADGGCRRVRGGFIGVESVFETPAARLLSERIIANTRRFAAALPASVLNLADS